MAIHKKIFSVFGNQNNSVLLLTVCSLYIISLIGGVSTECTTITESGVSYDLKLIKKWNPWVVKIEPERLQNTDVWSLLYINICDNTRATVASNKCSAEKSSVCLKQADKYTNIGNYSAASLNYTLSQNGDGFRLDFEGENCTESGAEHDEALQTSITFKCGTTLGSPIFIGKMGCTYFFEWHSSVACKNADPDRTEVKCYLYDNKNNKRDLSPLIKTTGGYHVNSDTGEELYINVCRDIHPEPGTTGTANCPQGAAACHSGDNVGKATKQLTWLNDQHLQLRYENDQSPARCHGFKPKVTITFVCPQDEGRLSGGKDPLLLFNTNCQYDIEWQTEYACNAANLSSKTCHLSSDSHGVDIDLNPLKIKTDNPYVAEDKTNGYMYYMDVCANLSPKHCSGKDSGVCQQKVSSPDKVAGKANAENMELRYADGELSLTYKGGEICSSGFGRTSVISFECNKSAVDEGKGKPEFVGETQCTYFFEWETKYACLEHPAETSCTLTNDKTNQRFDLSPLVRVTGNNWQALDGRHDHEDGNHGQYFINICADIRKESPATSQCPDGSAACFLSDNGQQKRNLGRFSQSPVFDQDGLIVLTYTDGDGCKAAGKNISTVITFLCAPGDLESAPSLVRKSDDGCLFEFEWRTAAACALGRKYGTDCMVFDDDAGISFNLTPLKKADSYVYRNDTLGYEFFLNVCDVAKGANVPNVPCANAGACQHDLKENGKFYNMGAANSTLEYYDGVLKLAYENGDAYNEDPPRYRKTEIAFLCDTDIDIGIPEYQNESKGIYFFKMHTKYACPEQSIECIVTDETTHEQYDLSSLSKALEEENWSFVDDSTDPSVRTKYYINVCRPINPVKGCGSSAAICQAQISNNKETITIGNLGFAKSQPTIESSGHLMLKYVDGRECTLAGVASRIESHIHFSCRKGILGSSPRLLEKVNDCVYSFIWETEAACPIDTTTGENCSVKDPNSEYVFNLQPLISKTYYDVVSPDNKHFQLNICNKTKGDTQCPDGSSACFIDGSTKLKIGCTQAGCTQAGDSVQPKFSDDGLLTLSYTGEHDGTSGERYSTEISFLCRRNILQKDQKPDFVRAEDKTYIFNFETPLACLPESVDCLVSDSSGKQYDLSALKKDTGNWEAVDTREGKEHLSYHINVCRPINGLSGTGGADSETVHCPGGPIGACQTDSQNQKSFNMGYVQAMPEASDGSLSIRYVNGDKCHDGKYHRSTRINFECSNTPGSPVFLDETDECEYIFTWETPAACPLETVIGHDCKVQVERFDFEFDLSVLKKTDDDYYIPTPEFTYQINVCGPLVKGNGVCAGSGNVGACQTNKDGNAVLAGIVNQNIKYDEGVLLLNYTDGLPCHNEVYKRSTAISFFCDDTLTGNGEPRFIDETTDCTYLFEWATPHACHPTKIIECSYRSDGKQYDLAPLAGIENNYKVVTSNGADQGAFYINMCRTLLHKKGLKGWKCPYNSAACLETTKSDGTKSYGSLGEVSAPLTWENGHLVMRYSDGDLCPDMSHMHSTEISIQCDRTAVGGLPQFSYASEDCVYYFTWYSNLACDIANDDEDVSHDCTSTNPATGHVFDLNSLSKEGGYEVEGKDGHTYSLNVCGALTGSGCKETEDKNVGICQMVGDGRSFNGGNFNRNLRYDDQILSLSYEGGTPCHNAKYSRSSVINFVCPQEENSAGKPVFIDESDDCTYYFSWHTSLVCEHFIQCTVTASDGHVVDLSPLVNSQGYFLATSLDEADPDPYYINLCHPLNPIPGIMCPAGAAACKATMNQKPVSLGRVEEAPQFVDERTVTITYINGDPCDEDKSRNTTSIISLQCAEGLSTSSPVMTSYKDCTYTFVWETNAVCPPAAPDTDKDDCQYYNNVLDYTFNLDSLASRTKPYGPLRMVPNSGQYYIHLCKSLGMDGDCSNAAICKKDGDNYKSLGDIATQDFSFEGHQLKVRYTGGSSCEHGEGDTDKRETTIIFKCAQDGRESEPTFFSVDSKCHYVFQWSTSLACPPMTEPCELSYQGNIFDLQPLSQITGSWTFNDDQKNTYYLNLCQPAYNTPDGCPKEAAMCRMRADQSTVDVLGMVYTQQLTAAGSTNSPEITMKLGEGSPFSCGADTSKEPSTTEVEIVFKCAKKVGHPVYKKQTLVADKTCLLTFEWETKVACPEKRSSVAEKNGKIQDPVTDKIIDLSPLMNQKGNWPVAGDERDEKSGAHSSYKYYINLGSKTSAVDGDGENICKNAAVCQIKTDGTFYREIGQIKHKEYFIEGEILEIEITSPDSCSQKDTQDVMSTIILQCDPHGNLGQPKFLYESSNCQYYFEWVTSAACDSVNAVNPKAPNSGGGGHDVETHKHSEVSTVIGVLAGIVLICVLVIVFHKKERRSAFYWKIRRCLPGAYSNVPAYSYAQLSSGDSEENLIGLNSTSRGLFSDDEEDEELLKDTRTNPQEYRDDSDEEILPNV